MSIKSWMLHTVQNIGAVTGRSDLPSRHLAHAREPGLSPDDGARPEASAIAEAKSVDIGQLGIYAPLIGAVRNELERFVASHLRLHVVIADRDRFVLTAIGIRSPGGDEPHDVLQKFMQEFRPEQVKRFLAREVIGRLPNAAVIDLTQFAGLTDLEAHDPESAGDEYGELIAALRATPPATAPLPYQVSILGRWIEGDAVAAAPRRSRDESFVTPLSGERWEFDIHDRDGARTVALVSVVPGRRYVIGKGAHCDIRVNGAYTSRRHAELRLEHGRWQVADVDSTNGIRVEGPAVRALAGDSRRAGAEPGRATELAPGMRLVLSANADGPPADYPWIALTARARDAASAATPIAAAVASTSIAAAVPLTPRTAVLSARVFEPVFEIRESRDDGIRVHAFRSSELPFTVGRSRGETLVVEWRHEGVSGHHLRIDRIDEHAAHGLVEGDNGIDIGVDHHGAGERFRWPLGETLRLGGSLPGEPACSLGLFAKEVH